MTTKTRKRIKRFVTLYYTTLCKVEVWVDNDVDTARTARKKVAELIDKGDRNTRIELLDNLDPISELTEIEDEDGNIIE